MRGLRSDKGFTLIELLIVVVIIGILATILISRFTGVKESAYVAHINTAAEQVKTASAAFLAASVSGDHATGLTDCQKFEPALWSGDNGTGLTMTWDSPAAGSVTITHTKITSNANVKAVVDYEAGSITTIASMAQGAAEE
ncbi:MAG TPA: type II secretion system protein [archaeon]|nr:type II secretion system protein [archaeon]